MRLPFILPDLVGVTCAGSTPCARPPFFPSLYVRWCCARPPMPYAGYRRDRGRPPRLYHGAVSAPGRPPPVVRLPGACLPGDLGTLAWRRDSTWRRSIMTSRVQRDGPSCSQRRCKRPSMRTPRPWRSERPSFRRGAQRPPPHAADVHVPGVPLAQAGRHGDAAPRHGHAVWGIPRLGVPRQRAEKVDARSLGPYRRLLGASSGGKQCPGQPWCRCGSVPGGLA